MANIISFVGKTPVIHPTTFVAPDASVIGDVVLDEGSSVWFGATLRGDVNRITVGKFSNIQDGCVVHAERFKDEKPGVGPTFIGDHVSIGHSAVIHACTIEDCCLIGMGSIILDGAVIGKGSIVGAGAVVTAGTVIPPYSMVLGTPGKVVKTMPESSVEDRIAHAMRYAGYSQQYIDAKLG
ncbi:MAG: gamma carbonic anhydrase family protein [Oscillospiraceae bacterium]|nr:gamma carbonic anhydrase family protein [Oscillospiraceae bacterium]